MSDGEFISEGDEPPLRRRSDFERRVLEELQHLREQQQRTNEALEWVLKALKVDEERHEDEAAT